MDTRRGAELSKYRFERALRTLEEAKNNFYLGSYNLSANRAYYAIFYGMLAVTANDGFEASKHSSVSSYFRKNYVKTKIFDKNLSDIITEAFNTRTYSDYEDYYEVSPEEAENQISNAEFFLEAIRPYLETCWAEMEEKYK